MDALRWGTVCALFDEIVELSPEERSQRLDEVHRSDPEAARAVTVLLRHDTLAPVSAIGAAPQTRPEVADPLGISGTILSHFRVLAPLAVGGMGVVYHAEDERLARRVALKLLLPELRYDADARARFLREGRAAGALDHPNVCRIHEVGESADGQPFIAMALYHGETLKQRLDRDGALPVAVAADIARQVARGLAAAHEEGIVHRDLKPANVMLLPDGAVKVLDFGLAKVTDPTLVTSQVMLGTASYMSPEQVRGAQVEHRADLWALGVVLYEMLAGQRPFAGEHQLAVAHGILHGDPPSLRALRREVPWRLEALVMALLRKVPNERPASATMVVDELSAITSGERELLHVRAGTLVRRALQSRRGRLAIGLVVLAAGFAAASSLTARTGTRPTTVAATRPTKSAAAYDFFVRGFEYERRVPSLNTLRDARTLYQRAIAVDSTFALARARLAITYLALLGGRFETDPAHRQRAQAEATAALMLQPDLPEGHLAMGHLARFSRDPDRALREYDIARAGMPTSAEPDNAMANVHRSAGRWREAVAHFERAASLNPTDIDVLSNLAMTQSRLRNYAASIAAWDRVIALAPDHYFGRIIRGQVFVRWTGTADSAAVEAARLPPEWDDRGLATLMRVIISRLQRRPADGLAALQASRVTAAYDDLLYRPRSLMAGALYAQLGDSAQSRARYAEAVRVLEDSVRADSSDLRMRVALAEAYAGVGRRRDAIAEAQRVLKIVSGLSSATAASAYMAGAAEVFAHAGARDEALAILERLLAMPAGREASVALLRADPSWDPLRRDPRFDRMLARFDTAASSGRD